MEPAAVTDLPLGRSDSRRQVARLPSIVLKNRYFERNPVQNDEGASAISRPRLKKFMSVGAGPIRKVFSEPGAFADAAFVISAGDLYSIDTAGDDTLIGTLGAAEISAVDMAVVAPIGGTPERLFIANSGLLWAYASNGQAIGHLEASGAPANNDTVTIDGVVYKFTTGSVDTGTPDGSAGNPWLVARTGVAATDLEALYHAINDSGDSGTEYSTALTAHDAVEAYSFAAADLYIAARVTGTQGNLIATTEASANLAWTAAALQDGGQPLLRQIPVPEDYIVSSIGQINSYIIVAIEKGQGVNGQFYWIEPGEVTIDPLNFATAERSPDAVNQVTVFSDMFWLLGQKTAEPWQTTGNLAAPVRRFEGILYDRGCWEGSAVPVKDSLILCDQDGAVFQIQGGLKRISRPDIEERIRRAIQDQGA